jgi:hypothetical protein
MTDRSSLIVREKKADSSCCSRLHVPARASPAKVNQEVGDAPRPFSAGPDGRENCSVAAGQGGQVEQFAGRGFVEKSQQTCQFETPISGDMPGLSIIDTPSGTVEKYRKQQSLPAGSADGGYITGEIVLGILQETLVGLEECIRFPAGLQTEQLLDLGCRECAEPVTFGGQASQCAPSQII